MGPFPVLGIRDRYLIAPVRSRDQFCGYIVPYADQVMARAKAYGFQGGQATPPDAANALVDAQAGGCAQAADDLGAEGVPGRVRIAPDANFPGQPIKQATLDFLAKMAGLADRTIIVTTGTRHSILTVNGGRSDHADGYAADIGMTASAAPTTDPSATASWPPASSPAACHDNRPSPPPDAAACTPSPHPGCGSSASGRPMREATTTITCTLRRDQTARNCI